MQFNEELPDTQTIRPIYITSGGTAIVVIAMFLFSVIILYTTNQNEESAIAGVWGSVAFFLFGTPIGLLAVNGGIASMFASWQEQRTFRQLHRLQYDAQMEQTARAQVVDHPRLPSVPSAPPMQLPQSPTFVSPIPPADEQLKLACYQFVRALFDEGGRPSPKRVLAPHTKSPGLVQYEKPKPDVVEYLKSLYMVWENERKQLFFDVDRYPTLRKCVTAIKIGTPAGTTEPPPIDAPYPSPQYESGEAQ